MKKILFTLLFVIGLSVFLVNSVAAYTFPSTNEDNKNGTNPVRSGVGPHVNFVGATENTVTLEFVMPYAYFACFEYRADGEDSQYGNIYPHPVISGDYWYYYFCMNLSTTPETRTFQANEYVEVRLAVGAERDWDFDWTRFYTLPKKTIADEVVLGVNRHMWDGEKWVTLIPKGRGGQIVESGYTIDQTHGYNCTQILDAMSLATGESFGGHYKFGCSKSVMEAWIEGKYHLENLYVSAESREGKTTDTVLKEGNQYILKSSGTYSFATWAGNPIADARYSYRGDADPLGKHGEWVDGADLPGAYKHHLQLWVKGSPVDWQGNYTDNIYHLEYTGEGETLHFFIEDGNSYGDNKGGLDLDIYAKLHNY